MTDYLGNVLRSGATPFGRIGGPLRSAAHSGRTTTPAQPASLPHAEEDLTLEPGAPAPGSSSHDVNSDSSEPLGGRPLTKAMSGPSKTPSNDPSISNATSAESQSGSVPPETVAFNSAGEESPEAAPARAHRSQGSPAPDSAGVGNVEPLIEQSLTRGSSTTPAPDPGSYDEGEPAPDGTSLGSAEYSMSADRGPLHESRSNDPDRSSSESHQESIGSSDSARSKNAGEELQRASAVAQEYRVSHIAGEELRRASVGAQEYRVSHNEDKSDITGIPLTAETGSEASSPERLSSAGHRRAAEQFALPRSIDPPLALPGRATLLSPEATSSRSTSVKPDEFATSPDPTLSPVQQERAGTRTLAAQSPDSTLSTNETSVEAVRRLEQLVLGTPAAHQASFESERGRPSAVTPPVSQPAHALTPIPERIFEWVGSSAGTSGTGQPSISAREPQHRLAAVVESLLESKDSESNRSAGSAPVSSPIAAAPREPVTIVRERPIGDKQGGRGITVREHSPRVTIGRLEMQVINQSVQKASENTRSPIRGTDEHDSIGRRMLGRFDLV